MTPAPALADDNAAGVNDASVAVKLAANEPMVSKPAVPSPASKSPPASPSESVGRPVSGGKSGTGGGLGAGPRNVRVAADVRSKVLARPFVRKALELSDGSLIEVVRRDALPPSASKADSEEVVGELDAD